MITPDIKAQAMARLQRGFTPEDISEELGIPVKLLKEWKANLTPNQMISLHANMHAAEELIARTVSGEILENGEVALKDKLEKCATDIVDQTSLVVSTNDLVRAKTLQLCADTVSKLYSVFITKGAGAPGAGSLPNSQTAFQRLLRD